MASNTPLIVIAAGGAGSRIGGAKPAQLLDGERLIDRAARWARHHSDKVALAVRERGDDWQTGLPCLADSRPGIGPISALHSAMVAAQNLGCAEALLIGCDMPFLPGDLIARLGSALQGHAAALPMSQGQMHPMAGLWRCDSERLDRWIAAGGRSLWRYAEETGLIGVEWETASDPFVNINDPESLAAAEERIRNLAH